MAIDRIIVGTDFSDQAQAAIDHAADLARHRGSQLIVAHAGTVPAAYTDEWPSLAGGTVAQLEAMVREQYDSDRAILGELCDRLAKTGVQVEADVTDAPPSEGLQALAAEKRADLIVVGSHGRSGLSRLWLGSVAEHTAAHANLPVMIARGPAPGAGGYKRILVPTDFGATADAALALALELKADGEGTIDVVYAWHVPSGARDYWARTRTPSDVVDAVREQMAEWVDERGGALAAQRSARVNVAFAHSSGDPREAIEQRMDEHDYDLVVIGTGHRHGRLGRVTEYVLRSARCSVVVVPAPVGD